MGGNALKHVGVERKEKSEYNHIVSSTLSGLHTLFPNLRVAEIPAYAAKTSFGDADLLISTQSLPSNWIDQVKNYFHPHDFLSNGSVHSFDHQQLQIDLICVPEQSFDFALAYFSYNDLGNLIGRIAHKMGFKYGHLGLLAPLRDGTHQYAEIPVSYNVEQTLAFLGYDPKRHQQGFDTLEDIFSYVASSAYVHSDIYLLMNRNAKSRIRDSKRPTYNAFLEWLTHHPEANRYSWKHSTDPAEHALLREQEKLFFMEQAFAFFPGFRERYHTAVSAHAANKHKQVFFNGNLVRDQTGFEGSQLGEFLQFCQKDERLSHLISQSDKQAIALFINEQKEKFVAEKPRPKLR